MAKEPDPAPIWHGPVGSGLPRRGDGAARGTVPRPAGVPSRRRSWSAD